MPEFADPIRQRTANPFSGVSRPTTGAIVPYRPNSSAMTPIARPPAAIPRPPVVPRAAQTIEQIRANTVRAPLPKNWDVATSRVTGLTPKANVPLANKINARLARGVAIPAAAAPAARGAAGWLGRARGVFTRVAPVLNRAVGVYGWITLAADGMEAVRPQVWQLLGIQVPGGEPSRLETVGDGANQYRVTISERHFAPSPYAGQSSTFVSGPHPGPIRNSVVTSAGDPVSYGVGYGENNQVAYWGTLPRSFGYEATIVKVERVTGGTTVDVPLTTSTGVGTSTSPATDFKNPQRSPAGKAGQNPKALPTSQSQRSPKPSTRPQNPTTTKPKPFPQPNPDGPPSITKPPPQVKPGECDPCEALEWIVEEMNRQKQQPKPPATYRLLVPYVVCEGKEVGKEGSIRYYAFDVIQEPGDWREIFTASAELALKGCECNDNAVASIPDWWQVRLGAERPQLVVVFKIAGTTAYHQIAIPHPAISEPPGASPLPPYRKGPYQGQLVLADNSKFTINAASESEAQRMIDSALQSISRNVVGSEPRILIGKRKGVAVKEADMIPIRLDYYPTGQRNMKPAWRKRLESKAPSR